MDYIDIDHAREQFLEYRYPIIGQLLKRSAAVLIGAVLLRFLFPAWTEGTSLDARRLFALVLLLAGFLLMGPLLQLFCYDYHNDNIWAIRCDAREAAGSSGAEILDRLFTCKGFWARRKEMFRAGMLTGWDIVLYLIFAVVLGGLMLAILPGEAAVMAVWSLPVVAYLVVMTQREDYIIARFLIMRGEGKKKH